MAWWEAMCIAVVTLIVVTALDGLCFSEGAELNEDADRDNCPGCWNSHRGER